MHLEVKGKWTKYDEQQENDVDEDDSTSEDTSEVVMVVQRQVNLALKLELQEAEAAKMGSTRLAASKWRQLVLAHHARHVQQLRLEDALVLVELVDNRRDVTDDRREDEDTERHHDQRERVLVQQGRHLAVGQPRRHRGSTLGVRTSRLRRGGPTSGGGWRSGVGTRRCA